MEKFKQFLYKTKDFLDKYWKVIVICVGVILLMGQCSSCNRDNRVEKYSELTDSLRLEILHLNDRLTDSKTFVYKQINCLESLYSSRNEAYIIIINNIGSL